MQLLVFLYTVVVCLLPHSALAGRSALCWPFDAKYGYCPCCPICGPFKPGNSDNSGAAPNFGLPTLRICNNRQLNIAECAHQCACDITGSLICREWSGCTAEEVTDNCWCQWDEIKKACQINTFNVSAENGGACFCPGP